MLDLFVLRGNEMGEIMPIKNEVMNDFDFKKVAKVMKSVGWKYGDSGSKFPTVDRLKDVASGLLDDILNDATVLSASTGGFKVYWESLDDDGSFKILKLDFILESGHAFK